MIFIGTVLRFYETAELLLQFRSNEIGDRTVSFYEQAALDKYAEINSPGWALSNSFLVIADFFFETEREMRGEGCRSFLPSYALGKN